MMTESFRQNGCLTSIKGEAGPIKWYIPPTSRHSQRSRSDGEPRFELAEHNGQLSSNLQQRQGQNEACGRQLQGDDWCVGFAKQTCGVSFCCDLLSAHHKGSELVLNHHIRFALDMYTLKREMF